MPFLFQDGIQQGIPPAALHPLVLAQTSFLPHADFSQHTRGGGVLCDAPRPYTVQHQMVEAERKERTGCSVRCAQWE
jgi:hypothetical protein